LSRESCLAIIRPKDREQAIRLSCSARKFGRKMKNLASQIDILAQEVSKLSMESVTYKI